MDIVVTGYAGFEGSKAIYNDKVLGSKLKERYSESFFGVFRNADAEADADIHDCSGLLTDSTNYRDEVIHDTDEAVGTGSRVRSESCVQTGDIRLSELDRLYNTFSEEGLAADGSSGGVLAALWRVLKNNHKGGMYALGDIPIRSLP